jgi:hypothetical protein
LKKILKKSLQPELRVSSKYPVLFHNVILGVKGDLLERPEDIQ